MRAPRRCYQRRKRRDQREEPPYPRHAYPRHRERVQWRESNGASALLVDTLPEFRSQSKQGTGAETKGEISHEIIMQAARGSAARISAARSAVWSFLLPSALALAPSLSFPHSPSWHPSQRPVRSTREGLLMASASCHDFELPLISVNGSKSLRDYSGRVLLITNVASLHDDRATSEFHALNALQHTFGDALAVLAVPCNQFGHQKPGWPEETPEGNAEFARSLHFVRPGNGFEFAGELFGCTKVNGKDQHPLFRFLKRALPRPHDTGAGDSGSKGVSDVERLVLSRAEDSSEPLCVTQWAPVARSDVAGNFEKFIVGNLSLSVPAAGRDLSLIHI